MSLNLHRLALSHALLVLAALLGAAPVSGAPLELNTSPDQRHVFGGGTRGIPLQWSNPGQTNVVAEIHCALYQTGSSTAAPLGTFPWKTLSVLPEQSVLERALVDLPAVRAETGCILKWVDTNDAVLGTTCLQVYPTNLLQELQAVAPIGVFDPGNHIKPVMLANNVRIVDLESTDSFNGRLAIALPSGASKETLDRLKARFKMFAKAGVPGVFFRTASARPSEIPPPSFFLVRKAPAAIVSTEASEIANFENDPVAQLRFLNFARLALRPELMPDFEL